MILVGVCAVVAFAATMISGGGGSSVLDGLIENRMRAKARKKLEGLSPGGKVSEDQIDKAIEMFKSSGGKVPKIPTGALSGMNPQDVKRQLKERGFSEADIKRAKKAFGR